MANPPLADLQAFAAVARWRSFRKAALELGVSPSALSHNLRGLEERLGVRLLHRTTRSVAPTEAGERLLARLDPALGEIAGALEEVNHFRATPMGNLRLNVPRDAAALLLVPHVGRFLAAYPQLRLEIVTDDRLVDIVAAGFDAGIRFGDALAADMVAVPLGPPVRFAMVAAPSYLAERGIPRHPDDLRAHRCIRHRFPSGAYYRWELEKDGDARRVEVDGPLALADQALTAEAAASGAGIGFVFEPYAAAGLASGRLQRVLEDWCQPMPGFHLYYPSRRQVSAGLRAFAEFFRQLP